MTDSEEDILGTNNIYTFQNESTNICAKGPNFTTNTMAMSFRNNCNASAFNIPRNFEKRRNPESISGQINSCYRRETSPMSLRSVPSVLPRNFQYSYYNGAASQRSYSGRGGSPMSVRSIGSNMSVSAREIAQAFKSEHFNKNDLRIIKEAYNKFMKNHRRKRIEKRRNFRLFLKGHRRKSGYDSGEQGSNSSISSDDCKSTRTGITMYRSMCRDERPYKKSLPSYKSSCDLRTTRPDMMELKKTLIESEMYQDCSDSLRQNNLRNMIPSHTAPVNLNCQSSSIVIKKTVPQASVKALKDRFSNVGKSGFLLPSQRFNKSTATLSIPEEQEKVSNNKVSSHNVSGMSSKESFQQGLEGDQEEIFSEMRPLTKRSINHIDCIADSNLKKKRKIISPIKPLKSPPQKNQSFEQNKSLNKSKSDFQFVKPLFPIRKLAIRPKEKLIAKSVPLTNTIAETEMQGNNTNVADTQNTKEQTYEEPSEVTQNSTTDVSMRPSFIKRKLFTQTLDMTERKNTSSDSVSTASPQGNVYSNIAKEKNKTRKLVNNQLCLNREIQEDSNLLDLIHKIVPLEQMNSTCLTTAASNTTQQQKSCDRKKSSNKIPDDDDDKWDITSIISTCDNNNLSDTFTDEEIFDSTNITIKDNNKNNTLITKAQLKNKQSTTKDKSPLAKIISKKTTSKTENEPTKIKKAVESQKAQDLLESNLKSNETHTHTDAAKSSSMNKSKAASKNGMNNNTCNNKTIKVNKMAPVIVSSGQQNCKKDKVVNNTMLNSCYLKTCKVLVKPVDLIGEKTNLLTEGPAKKSIHSYVESFWNTDVESDADCSGNTPARVGNAYNNKRYEQGYNKTLDINDNSKQTTVKKKNPFSTKANKTMPVKKSNATDSVKPNDKNKKADIQNEKLNTGEKKNTVSMTKENSSLKDTIAAEIKNTVNPKDKIDLSDCKVIPSLGKKKIPLTKAKKQEPPKKTKLDELKKSDKSKFTSKKTHLSYNDSLNTVEKEIPLRNAKQKLPSKGKNELDIKKAKYNTKKINMSDTLLSSNQSFCKSLRTRNIDISIESEKVEKKRIGKENFIKGKDKKNNENSQISDMSFTIDKPQKERNTRRINKTLIDHVKDKNPRLSNVSFTLRSSKTPPINRSITRSQRLSGKKSRRL